YAGGPGPLEVVAAEPSGDVHDLADEVEARGEAGLEGAGVEGVGGDTAGGDFRLGEAFGAGGRETPGMEITIDRREGGVGQLGLRVCLRGGEFELQPSRGGAGGQY